jgi:hypothetical protein
MSATSDKAGEKKRLQQPEFGKAFIADLPGPAHPRSPTSQTMPSTTKSLFNVLF